MGLDAEIYIRVRDGVRDPELANPLPVEHVIARCSDDCIDVPNGSPTHEVENPERYFGSQYPVGCWPRLGWTLLTLLTSKDVIVVWYGAMDGNIGIAPFTKQTWIEYTEEFLA